MSDQLLRADVVRSAWFRGTPSQREELRAAWPQLADALDAFTWPPTRKADTGTTEAPVAPQNRSERAACGICQRPTDDGHEHGRDEWYQHRQEQRRRRAQAGDMHEPPAYPASRLHFE